MIDLVFPRNNEEEFIRTAEKLGYKAICLAYTAEKDIPDMESIRKKARESEKMDIYFALTGERPAKNRQTGLLIIKTQEKARHYMEKTRIDLVYGLEDYKSRDFIHQRDSGLDHVMCAIANKKDKIIGIDFNSVLTSKSMLRSRIMGRMMQNIRLCRKYDVKTAIASFARKPEQMRSAQDLISFGIVIGMRPENAKKALLVILDRIKLNLRKKSGEYIAEGIERV